MCKYFNKEEFIAWQNIDEKQDEIFAFLRAAFLEKDRDEWNEILQKVDVFISPVLTLKETFEDHQVIHRKMMFEMEHPRLGKIKQLGFPIKMSETPAKARTAPPELGEHNNEIYGKLGYSEEDIKQLNEQGII